MKGDKQYAFIYKTIRPFITQNVIFHIHSKKNAQNVNVGLGTSPEVADFAMLLMTVQSTLASTAYRRASC